MTGRMHRKEFLRLCALAAAGAAVASCQAELPTPAPEATRPPATDMPAPTAPPSPTPAPQAQLALAGPDVDAWTWNKQVVGIVQGQGQCAQILLRVNGVDYPAEMTGEVFSAEIPLEEGANRVVAICRRPDGQEVSSDMVHYQERLRQVPKAVIQISLEDGRLLLNGSGSQPAEANGPQIIDHIWSARPGNPAPLQLAGEGEPQGRVWDAKVSGYSLSILPPQTDGEYYVRLTVKDQAGRQDQSTSYFVVENGLPRIPNYDKENTAWVEKAVVYGVIPGKFGSPAFKAITQKLDYLAELGVNALWLAPVNVSPPDDYGYAVVDYFELSGRYGDKEDFHRMVQEAHARGIRVLMDFVPNHSSARHPYFLDTLEKGKDSPYWEFYDRDEAGNPTHYFNWEHLPNLNYFNPEVQRWMLEAFAYWVREFDVDGFRVDVAWGIRQRNPEFWPIWRSELKRIKPDLLLLAEASARDPYYFDNGYDAAYDWTDQLGKWAWEQVWGSYKNRLLAYNLDVALTNRPEGFHPDALIFRFLNNNDTDERFITRHGEGMARVSTALLLTLPGIPCIYTGDEVGAEFRPYYDPMPLAWQNLAEKNADLRAYHQKLISLRKGVAGLHARGWQPVEHAPLEQTVYAYLRYDAAKEQPVLVVLNFSEEPAEVKLNLPEEFGSLGQGAGLTDLLSGDRLPAAQAGSLTVPVAGLAARILAGQEPTAG